MTDRYNDSKEPFLQYPTTLLFLSLIFAVTIPSRGQEAQLPDLLDVPSSIHGNAKVALDKRRNQLVARLDALDKREEAWNKKYANQPVSAAGLNEKARIDAGYTKYADDANVFNSDLRGMNPTADVDGLPLVRASSTFFVDFSGVDLRDITNRTVDPARVREGPFKSSSIQFSQPEQVVLSDPLVAAKAVVLGQRWSDDPRYKEIQKRWQNIQDMALLQPPHIVSAEATAKHWSEIRNFYTVKAMENHRSDALNELRNNSDALRIASEQIDAEEKQRISQSVDEFRRDLGKAIADPSNRKGLDPADPDLIGPLANRASSDFHSKVAALETLAQVKYLGACHNIVTLGNRGWKLSDFSLEN
jgi:hypothetical protein